MKYALVLCVILIISTHLLAPKIESFWVKHTSMVAYSQYGFNVILSRINQHSWWKSKTIILDRESPPFVFGEGKGIKMPKNWTIYIDSESVVVNSEWFGTVEE